MKFDIDNANFTKEKLPAFLLENKDIELIKDIEAMAVYTYLKMLLEEGFTLVQVIIEKISKHFSISEVRVLDKLKILEALGLFGVIKQK